MLRNGSWLSIIKNVITSKQKNVRMHESHSRQDKHWNFKNTSIIHKSSLKNLSFSCSVCGQHLLKIAPAMNRWIDWAPYALIKDSGELSAAVRWFWEASLTD